MISSSNLSKNQIDRLGNRLRKGGVGADDLRLLNSYRQSFARDYEVVIGKIRDQLDLETTGRPAKSTSSIIDKLQRESIRLTQVQDIAGCRIIVNDIVAQDQVVARVLALFNKSAITDRRAHPSHGYRAVHIVVNMGDKQIEIQIRTMLQHVWAELSEKLSDVVDKSVKYGGGGEEIVRPLHMLSDSIHALETKELIFHQLTQQTQDLTIEQNALPSTLVQQLKEKTEEARQSITDHKQGMIDILKLTIQAIIELRGR